MKKLLNELKEFIFRGNVIDMAVGVIIGSAFSAIINSLVNDIFMPLLSLLTGKINFSSMFIPLDGNDYATLDAAKSVDAATLNYGAFITAVINFLLIAVCIFFFIKLVSRLTSSLLRKQEAEKKPRLCPYCFGELNEKAVRCPHCTSDVSATANQA